MNSYLHIRVSEINTTFPRSFFPFERVNSHERTQLAQNNIKLEIRFCKNLAKLTGSVVRIKSKKPKGKKTMKEKKKTGGSHAGI